ncbi:MAG: hypothetical protein JSS09_09625, partial [Verrucomicrobia bacterium]|nr:hypothetical protein [Verrucomicrobiota bacterium]
MEFKNLTYHLCYGALRCALYPFSLLPYKALHFLGRKIGVVLFYLYPKYRKRTLSNLSLASDLCLQEKDLHRLAKESLGNLLTTCLEYSKLSSEKKIHALVTCDNPFVAQKMIDEGKGVIFLCGHQANWELFFLEGTSRMPGVAIGQPIKNTPLYDWILSIREKFGGKIVLPKQAVKEGLRALKQGKFLGVVGDQGMPGSGFCAPFLGRPAFTSPLPALLSYRSNSPLITATMIRKEGKYVIHYSEPLFPNLNEPMETEVPRLLKQALYPLELSIKENPAQWLWQHNRWKQQLLGRVKKIYRQDAIAIILPKNKELWKKLCSELTIFRDIYPTELLCFFTPFPILQNL